MESRTVKLGDIADITTGKTPSKRIENAYGNVIKFLTPRDFNGRFSVTTERMLSDQGYQAVHNKVVSGPSVSVTCIGSDMGKVIYNRESVVTNQQVNTLSNFKSNTDPLFLYYLLSTKKKELLNYGAGNGSTMPIITKSMFSQLEIKLPSVKVQRKLVACLNPLDDKIELNRQINKNLLRLMSVQWNKLFGSLNAENGHFTDLATITAGGTPSKKNDDYFGGDISWITPKDMSLTNDVFIERGALNITDAGLKGSSAKLLPKGTLLFSSRAPIGYLGIAANPVTTNQGFKSLVPKRDENTEYLYFLLINLTSYIEGIAGGSTFKEISGAGMKSVEFPLPTNNQIDAFHNQVAPMFDLVKNNERQNKNLTKLRNLLLPKLLAGDIDLSNIEMVMNNA
ncbi:HsdS, type I site-specific deoxyribonuclease [Lactiplantibacillus plantarum 4_3]|mgnify:CR=1 FL=1|uniref:restriction endonuclease subunit S n=1 Tax=Lactiplantibacillus plantarum TaxID=1590 RepID=UPI0003D3BD7E|nr:restriction endonuclease subunit S [Lactiplantibacillus plantarum]ETF12196.1 HsdS, type I site-specific deoxyribonuclease [Lactiplantibacillus plantarum 4_3]